MLTGTLTLSDDERRTIKEAFAKYKNAFWLVAFAASVKKELVKTAAKAVRVPFAL